ncbi:hypothetical protein MNB_SV-14-1710 [hydrothermal vent metagenome]|uniref:Lipoprotein n=1 Tax=hydrothermal vent metagenome TaxID=652676 RepID=A0A1W1CV95_9ZZZZ
MKQKILLFTVLIFIGCNSSEEKEIATLKNNTWINPYCQTSAQFDQDGNPHYTYYKSVYRFKENIISERSTKYSDKNCKTSLHIYDDYNLTYYDLGLKENIDGYEIYDIKIEEKSSIVSEEKDALYAINHNQLCFSKSIYGNNVTETVSDLNGNLYTTNNSGIHIYSNRDNVIDYENCLIKK